MSVRGFAVCGFRFSVKTRKIGFLGILLALIISGMSAEIGAAESAVKARLVNKEPLAGAGQVTLHEGQVEVTLPDGPPKLLPHRSYLEPLVVEDQVFFLPTEGFKLTRIYIYYAKTDQTESFRLPLDMDPVFGSPSFSPDGKKIAYYLVQEQRVIVRTWPALKLLKQSNRHPVRPTDVPAMPPIWTSPAQVEFDPLFFLPERPVAFTFP
jgi:hypothetical protein